MKTLAIVAVILILVTAAGKGAELTAGVGTLGAAIAKLMPAHSSGDEQDGDSGGGEP
jgi:hypothetical protein